MNKAVCDICGRDVTLPRNLCINVMYPPAKHAAAGVLRCEVFDLCVKCSEMIIDAIKEDVTGRAVSEAQKQAAEEAQEKTPAGGDDGITLTGGVRPLPGRG